MSVWLIYVLKRKHRICFGILDIQCHVGDLLMNKEVAVKVGTRAKFKILKMYDICFILHTFYHTVFFFLFSNFFLSSFHSSNLIWKHDTIYYCIKLMSFFFINIYRCLYLKNRKFAQCSKEYCITFFDFFREITAVGHVIHSN